MQNDSKIIKLLLVSEIVLIKEENKLINFGNLGHN